ncbi:MAG: RNA polymerase sigma factor [Chloroflexi bacterium]|nr:MAG: RNA polymerase sigma factor [Chloroflexota bacterium]
MTQPAGTLSLFATLRQDADRSAHGPREHGGLADVQLVALAREDRAAAIEVMYSAHKGRIYTFLLRFLADAEMADDVTQDTFTKAYSALGSLTPSHRVLPWLYRIATNTALDHLRRRRRFAWIRMGAIANTADEPPMPDEHARVPEREHIQAVLRGLPPENSIALLLHAVEGYSYAEIAEIQGVTMTAVRSRIARARASFRRAYGDAAEGGAGGDQPA